MLPIFVKKGKGMAFSNSETKKDPKILGEILKAEKIQTQASVC